MYNVEPLLTYPECPFPLCVIVSRTCVRAYTIECHQLFNFVIQVVLYGCGSQKIIHVNWSTCYLATYCSTLFPTTPSFCHEMHRQKFVHVWLNVWLTPKAREISFWPEATYRGGLGPGAGKFAFTRQHSREPCQNLLVRVPKFKSSGPKLGLRLFRGLIE